MAVAANGAGAQGTTQESAARALGEKLMRLSTQIHSFQGSVILTQSLETADGSRHFPLPGHIYYELAFDHDDFYMREVRLPADGHDNITVRIKGEVKVWERDPESPGFGRTNYQKKEGIERSFVEHLAWLCPWHDLSQPLCYDFEFPQSSPRITGEVEYDGKKCVRMEWAGGQGASMALIHEEAVNVYPLLYECTRGDIKHTLEAHAMQLFDGGVYLPTEVVRKTQAPAKLCLALSGGELPTGVSQDDPLVFVQRLQFRDIKVNPTFEPGHFDLKWAPGTQVRDEATGVGYFIKEDQKNTADTQKSVEQQESAASTAPVAAASAPRGFYAWLLAHCVSISAGIGAVLVGGFGLWRRCVRARNYR